jgi:transcriptional regulator GlxA family with amidase domain
MQIAIGLYPHFTALDAVGPYEVLAKLATAGADAEVLLCAARQGDLVDENGLLHFNVAHTFDDAPAPDILLVPGGLITRRLARDGDPIIDWIRAAHPHTTYTTSVCTGALLLGAAGLLDGLRATTHWVSHNRLRSYGAEPVEGRVVEDGKILTAAGVSAGIDLALSLVGRIAGPGIAQGIQLSIEYDPRPPFDAGAPSKAPAEISERVRTAITDAEDRLLDTA